GTPTITASGTTTFTATRTATASVTAIFTTGFSQTVSSTGTPTETFTSGPSQTGTPVSNSTPCMQPLIYDSGNLDYSYGVAVDVAGNIYVAGYSYNGANNDWRTIKYNGTG